jgi:hypothetical protein
MPSVARAGASNPAYRCDEGASGVSAPPLMAPFFGGSAERMRDGDGS